MSIGARDYIGSSGFLASARGRAEGSANEEAAADAAAGGVATEDVLEHIFAGGEVTAQQVAERLSVDLSKVQPELEKLRKLDLVSCVERDNDRFYSLTEIGQRAREYGRIAKNSL